MESEVSGDEESTNVFVVKEFEIYGLIYQLNVGKLN